MYWLDCSVDHFWECQNNHKSMSEEANTTLKSNNVALLHPACVTLLNSHVWSLLVKIYRGNLLPWCRTKILCTSECSYTFIYCIYKYNIVWFYILYCTNLATLEQSAGWLQCTGVYFTHPFLFGPSNLGYNSGSMWMNLYTYSTLYTSLWLCICSYGHLHALTSVLYTSLELALYSWGLLKAAVVLQSISWKVSQ